MAAKSKYRKYENLVIAGIYVALAVTVFSQMQNAREDRILVISQETTLLPHPQTRLSKHDKHIESISEQHQIDWRLTAALIFVESSFNEKATSKVGAIGLMQVMPVVYRELRQPMEFHPEKNIQVGLTYFKKIHGFIQANTEEDRLHMTLAAYNGGLGHLRDAQRLAVSQGLDPYSWDDIRTVYPKLENAAFHKSATYGYCQGRGIVAYAEKITKKYKKLQRIYPMNRLQYSKNIYFSASEQYRS